MSLFYKEEHTTCYHYQLPVTADFRLLHFKENPVPQVINVDRSVLIFILSGEALITCNNHRDKLHKEGEMSLAPRNSCCYVRVLRDSVIISCAFVQNMDFCNRFSFHKLADYIPVPFVYDFTLLPINERIAQFLDFMKCCLEDGLGCMHLHELKKQELFLLLRAYYSKQELATFFYPLLGKDMDFKDLVLSNYLTVNSLNEFASLSNMSVATFKRRFKEEFGEPAHQWIAERKAELIYRDIILSDKPFGEIAMEYQMSSQAYLTSFCKRHFALSPQELRDKS